MNSLTLDGIVGMSDPPRRGVSESIAKMIENRSRVCMITGDARETAMAIASTLGFYDPRKHTTLSGLELEQLSGAELEDRIRDTAVFYRTSPRHKLAIVQALQATGEVVAMTGDGVN